jgi:hypothetical protein
MIENEIKAIYMNIENELLNEIFAFILDNELNYYNDYNVIIFANIHFNTIYFRYEIKKPELIHYFSQWYSQNYTKEFEQYSTHDELNIKDFKKDMLITEYSGFKFYYMQI